MVTYGAEMMPSKPAETKLFASSAIISDDIGEY